VPKLVFLDDDHVMTLTRTLIEPPGPGGDAWLRKFFAPDVIDVRKLRDLANGVAGASDMDTVLAKDDDDLADATAFIFRRGRISEDMFGRCPNLQFVQRLGASSRCIDLAAAKRHGVGVSCLERRSLILVAEHTFVLMLALSKRLLAADRAVRTAPPTLVGDGAKDGAYNWIRLEGIGGLVGQTLGIVGLGEIGGLVAKRGAAFGMKIVYTNRTRLSADEEHELNAEYRSMNALLEEADFVSVHANNFSENVGLLGADAFSRMRPTAFFINTSRGRLVDEDALYDALKRNRIAGAGLDVHAVEPRQSDDRFCKLDNVILTPHVSGGERAGVLDEVTRLIRNVQTAVRGGTPPYNLILPVRRSVA
jgi:phosphoglycerate dehydrogenase-like enzyme